MNRSARHAYLTPTSVVVGLFVALVGTVFTLQARRADTAAAQERFEGVAATAAQAMESQFDVALQVLVGATNAIHLDGGMSDTEFDHYIQDSDPPTAFVAWGVAQIDGDAAVVSGFHASEFDVDWLGFDLMSKRDFRTTVNSAIRTDQSEASAFLALEGLPTRSAVIVQPHHDEHLAFTIVNADRLSDGLPAELLQQVRVSASTSTQLADPGSYTVNRTVAIGMERWNVEVEAIDPSLTPSPLVGMVGVLATAVSTLMAVIITGGWSQRRQLRADVEANDRINEAREQFIASVSHEIRTPLTAVVGFADLLREGWDVMDDEERRLMVDQISEQSGEVSALVADLLVGSRADIASLHLAIEPVEVRTVIARAIASIPADLARRIPVTFDDARSWHADAGRATQIIRNLVVNALKYGGPHVSIESRRMPDTVVLSVIDDGDGVPPGAEEAIFRPFSSLATANQALPSVGLGLHVSLSLARAMGGSVVYRRAGGLTSFDLELPSAPVDQGVRVS